MEGQADDTEVARHAEAADAAAPPPSVASSADLLALEHREELREIDEALTAAYSQLEAEEAARLQAAAQDGLRSHPVQSADAFRELCVVTTAALPWMTGTAVNPALRAAYLAHRGFSVTLLVPWLPSRTQQALIFPGGITFGSPEMQAEHMLRAIEQRVGFCLDGLHISFYPGRYDTALCSIMPDSDLQDLVPPQTDLVILEEPEHLTWYHVGRRWTSRFPAVVGIMHTNYVDYIQRQAGRAAATVISHLNGFLCRQHCHLVIKLSDAVQQLPHQMTCFVHGVADAFRHVGAQRAQQLEAEGSGGAEAFPLGAYFLGKGLWAKGFSELLDRMAAHRARCEAVGCAPPELDVYGKGEDLDQIEAEAVRLCLRLRFRGPRDHMDPSMHGYRAFVNPSTSDVVATTSAEALAMGKWLVAPRHACNAFFEERFRNCLVYDDDEGFSRQLDHALSREPHPLTEVELAALSWEDATGRLLGCIACMESPLPPARKGLVRKAAGSVGNLVTFGAYNCIILAIESVRRALDAAKGRQAATARQAPGQPVPLGQLAQAPG